MTKNKLKTTMPLTLLALAWILYEIIMAWKLQTSFTTRDWMGLYAKLAFLTGLLASTLIDENIQETLLYISLTGPAMAGAVRATQGWLAYTWFPTLTSLLALLASLTLLIIYKNKKTKQSLALAVIALIYYTVTLQGRLYQAPSGIVVLDIIIYIILFSLTIPLMIKHGKKWWLLLLFAGMLAVLLSLMLIEGYIE